MDPEDVDGSLGDAAEGRGEVDVGPFTIAGQLEQGAELASEVGVVARLVAAAHELGQHARPGSIRVLGDACCRGDPRRSIEQVHAGPPWRSMTGNTGRASGEGAGSLSHV